MVFIGVGLFSLTLLGWMFLARKVFKINYAGSFFVGVQLLILSTYFLALLNLLLLGFYLVEILGILFFFVSLYEKRRSISFVRIIRYCYYLVPFLAFTVTIPPDFRFTMSDEFPSWAANIKTMYTENGLGGINSATRNIADGFYQSYPPFQQLFQYLYLKNTFWAESNVQTSQNILILTSLLGAVSLMLREKTRLIFPTWITSISIYFLFGFTMSNLLADGLLAVQFAACLGFSIMMKAKLREYLLLGLLISGLILIKPTGFVLALCSAILGISVLASSKKEIGNKKSWKSLIIFLSPPSLTYFSWQFHLRLIQMNPGAEKINLDILFSEKTRMRWNQTWTSYKSNFFGSLYGEDNLAGISSTAPKVVQVLHISLFVIFIFLAASQIILAFLSRELDRRSEFRNAFLIIILAVIYQFFLLFLYMFFFGEYEGIRSAALVRYSGSFFLGWSILVVILILKYLSRFRFSQLLVAVTVFCSVLVAPSALAREVSGEYTDASKLPVRLIVEKLVPATLSQIPDNGKIYYVYQGSNGYEKYIYSYLVLPRVTNWSCPSIGKPLYKGDVWTCDIPLSRAIQGYDYLVIGRADKKFWEDNSRFLAKGSRPTQSGIFKIYKKGRELTLTRLT